MTSKTRIFITRATGYIGGSVLVRFLKRLEVEPITLIVLVRSPVKAEKLRELGVHVVIGSLEDYALLERLTSDADVIVDTADADDVPAAQAILRGVRTRYDATGVAPVVIHTSGTGVLCDNAGGMYSYDTIWDDSDPDQIETLAPTQFHRNVDLEYMNADKQGYVKSYIILPGIVYGIATGKLVELGIQNPYSILIPLMVSACLDRGQGGMVGEGKNIWPHVHNDDLADLYLVLYDAIRSNPGTGHGREGIYFAENGECKMYELAKETSKALKKIGRGKSDEPTTFSPEEFEKYLMGVPFPGANSRCIANRSRSIGWKPSKTTFDYLASVEPEVECLSKQSPMDILKRYHESFEATARKVANT